jgi:phosphate starvation-inducible PhoH-like protein
MAKQTTRAAARDTKRRGEVAMSDYEAEQKVVFRAPPPLAPKTETQRRYINAIKNYPLVFGTGPAGTGKTFIAGAIAAEMLSSRRVEKIVITRPAVDAGESLGFLPGELEEKYGVYIQPFRDVLDERLGKSWVDNLLKLGKIEAAPLAFMRGRTFKNAIVILDEGQNTTPTQMKMFLTRIGENCSVIVNGDIKQKDIPGPSGLEDAIKRVSWIPSVKVIEFGRNDVVRSGLVQEIVQSYEQEERDLPRAA